MHYFVKFWFIILSLLLVSVVNAGELKPFTSDGCSAFPNGTWVHHTLWLKCCSAHDKSYWKGGTSQEREIADEVLKTCVEDVGEPAIAQLMLAGVRVGGTPYLPTEFRWGYGWPYFRGYKALTEEEKSEVRMLLNAQISKTVPTIDKD